jgi:hypothetical protein
METETKLKYGKRGRPSAAAKEAAIAAVKQREGPKLNDTELLNEIVSRFAMLDEMTEAAGKGQIPSLIVPGAPGIGKSYGILNTFERCSIRHKRITGGISAPELYSLSFNHRAKGNVIFIDDSDMVFKDEDTMNILKAMTDSSRVRTVSWAKQNREMANDGIDPEHVFNGSVIFASNKDFQRIVDEKSNASAVHMEALISRAYYMDLLVHTRRALSLWINYICTEGKMFDKEDVDPKTGKEILAWLQTNRDNLREYSLRTVHKMCALTKIHGRTTWQDKAVKNLCRPM